MPSWDEITTAVLYSRSQKLADIITKNNVLAARLVHVITSGNRALHKIARKRRNQRRAHNRWRVREARRNAGASALVPSTPALAAASRGLPKPGSPEAILAAIREVGKSR